MSRIAQNTYKILSNRSIIIRSDQILVKRRTILGSFKFPSDDLRKIVNKESLVNTMKTRLDLLKRGYRMESGQIILGSDKDLTIIEQDGSRDLIVDKGLFLTTTDIQHNPTRLSGSGIVALEANNLSILDLSEKLILKRGNMVAWDSTIKVTTIDEFETKDYSYKLNIKPLFQRMVNNTLNFINNNTRFVIWLIKMRIFKLGTVELQGPGRIFISP